MRLLALASFLFFVVLTQQTEAASLYLDPSNAVTGRGGSVSVSVRLDTSGGECINVVDGVLTFDEGLHVDDISIGASIFNFWVEPPQFDNDSRTISFAGGIPNGYCGRIPGDPQLTNEIAEIIFRTDSEEQADFSSIRGVYFDENSKGYLNDGLGTPISLTTSGSEITVTDDYVGGIENVWKERVENDTEPPKEFSITLTQNDSVFRGKYFIIFNTNDKQTGIDHYEVIEETLDQINLFGWGAATAPWVKSVSPYQLEDQSLNSTIRVKAVDKAGNEYVATLVPDESVRGVSVNLIVLYGLLLFAITVLVVAIWFGVHIWQARREEGVYDEDEVDLENDNEGDVGTSNNNYV